MDCWTVSTAGAPAGSVSADRIIAGSDEPLDTPERQRSEALRRGVSDHRALNVCPLSFLKTKFESFLWAGRDELFALLIPDLRDRDSGVGFPNRFGADSK